MKKTSAAFLITALLCCTGAFAEQRFSNAAPDAPWNDPLLRKDALAPWNDPLYRDDITAPWNDLSSGPEDTNEYMRDNGLSEDYEWR